MRYKNDIYHIFTLGFFNTFKKCKFNTIYILTTMNWF